MTQKYGQPAIFLSHWRIQEGITLTLDPMVKAVTCLNHWAITPFHDISGREGVIQVDLLHPLQCINGCYEPLDG